MSGGWDVRMVVVLLLLVAYSEVQMSIARALSCNP